jgi:hypothetical protein
MADIPKLLDSIRTMEAKQVTSVARSSKQPEMDVLIFRISQPWMSWEAIDEMGMLRTIAVAKELLNVKVVIFLTIPFSNNVVDKTDILSFSVQQRQGKDAGSHCHDAGSGTTS